MSKNKKSLKKVYVLDTSVIIYNHNAINTFEDNDVAIPITVLEELDNFKKGNDTKNFEAREFIRLIDQYSGKGGLQKWIPLQGKNLGKFKVIMTSESSLDANKIFGGNKGDHNILNAALSLQEEAPETRVILVTKDINLRLKAKSLNIHAEDYETGKVRDVNNLYSGKSIIESLDSGLIDELFKKGSIPRASVEQVLPEKNEYFILKNHRNSTLARYNPLEDTFERIDKRAIYGVKPRNAEQTFAVNAILDDNIKLVTVQGVAGTGKTLLALAAAIEQRKKYKQIFLARPIVPLSNKDIGFLPGDVKSKLNPYMEPLWDNLKFIKNQFDESDKQYRAIEDMVNKEKLVVQPLAYIRGRSLSNVIFIVDESQNLTPHEIKTIITRAGENAKFVFTGDVNQIDTPYLDSESNGLSYLIDRLKGSELFAHITLEKGERSELANLANELL